MTRLLNLIKTAISGRRRARRLERKQLYLDLASHAENAELREFWNRLAGHISA